MTEVPLPSLAKPPQGLSPSLTLHSFSFFLLRFHCRVASPGLCRLSGRRTTRQRGVLCRTKASIDTTCCCYSAAANAAAAPAARKYWPRLAAAWMCPIGMVRVYGWARICLGCSIERYSWCWGAMDIVAFYDNWDGGWCIEKSWAGVTGFRLPLCVLRSAGVSLSVHAEATGYQRTRQPSCWCCHRTSPRRRYQRYCCCLF